MNHAVEDTLEALLQVVGLSLASQARRLEGFLRDMHPDSPREVSVLIEAVERGVVDQIRSSQARMTAAERAVLVAALTEGAGLGLQSAEWAVAVWCRTLLGEAAERGADGTRRRASRVTDRPGSFDDVLGRAEGSQA